MHSRAWPWSVFVAIGSAAILAVYLTMMSRQGSSPVMWFVVALAVSGSLPLLGLVFPRIRGPVLVIAAAVLTVLSILTGFSIGFLILPVAGIALTAFVIDLRHAARNRSKRLAPAGWYADPGDSQRHRYWDGTMWTGYVT